MTRWKEEEEREILGARAREGPREEGQKERVFFLWEARAPLQLALYFTLAPDRRLDPMEFKSRVDHMTKVKNGPCHQKK